jgi:tRNA threonylcarbamoyladenosine biosynthesis protein TsaE
VTASAAGGCWIVPTADDMVALGTCLGKILRAGDVVLMDGELGAGKTTLTRGIAAGLGVAQPVTSPTFVIAREHPPTDVSPGLVHVDAYRLSGADEIDDLDLVPVMGTSVTVVEWASGVAEHLHAQPLLLTLHARDDDAREVAWQASGQRWVDDLSRVAGCGEPPWPRTARGRQV